jgi:NADPH-dependent curcumin reductase CurA
LTGCPTPTTDFAAKYEEAVRNLADWIRAGKLKYQEDIREGLESAPASIKKLYSGENQGKLIIRL